MSERFERLVTLGVPPINYNLPDTWTDEVRVLYERLKNGDFTALAPLLKRDIEFLTDSQAIRALVVLKYDAKLPEKIARAELRKIANVVERRPSGPRGRLPWGDWLEAELKGLTSLIEEHDLLKLKRDPRALQRKLSTVLREVTKEQADKLAAQLSQVAQAGRQWVRRPRSWALQVLAANYSTDSKQIEKRIDRERRSDRRRR